MRMTEEQIANAMMNELAKFKKYYKLYDALPRNDKGNIVGSYYDTYNNPAKFKEIYLSSTEAIVSIVNYCDKNSIPFSQNNLTTDFYNKVYSSVVLYHWRHHKKIYRFDQTVSEMMCENISDANTFNIPSEIFTHLPFNGLCIDLNIDDKKYPDLPRCIILNYDLISNGELGLRITPTYFNDKDMFTNELSVFCMLLTENNNYRNINIRDEILVTEHIMNIVKNKKIALEDIERKIMTYINYILYILSANVDKALNTKFQKTYRPRKPNAPILDKYREIETIDIGYKMGTAIRRYNEQDIKLYPINETEQSVSHKKIPHIRSGHWHHYWVGPKNKQSKRKLIVKWIMPTIINGYEITYSKKPILHPVVEK